MEVRPSKPAAAFGLAVGVVFILLGLFVVIPQFGPFGLLWTAVALIITILNGVNACLLYTSENNQGHMPLGRVKGA